jgi:transcriptional regulator with XRE-family HTH domain
VAISHHTAIVRDCVALTPPVGFQLPVGSAAKKLKTPDDKRRGERIKQLIRESGLTQRAYGEKIGLSQNSMSLLVTGATVPGDETLTRICAYSRTSRAWVLDGTGERTLAPGVQVPKLVRSPKTGERGHPDVARWLSGTDRGKSLTIEAKRWLRRMPWDEDERVPDKAIELALKAFQETHRGSP